MKKWMLISLPILFFIGFAGANYQGFLSPSFSSVVNKPIQRIDLIDLQGSRHSFDELKGNDTVIYFFASWCTPCYKSLMTLEQVTANKQLPINLLAIALDEDIDEINRMLIKIGFTGKVWIASEGKMALQKRYFGNERRAVPYVVKLDRDTNIIERSYKLNQLTQWQSVLRDGVSLNKI
ncbi:TlpA disulfide reductase family protein [Colwellia sp. MB3u-55]|uniref:TlpA family protein disulfide reductase n=1 Tax=Colwellia sp. MB3u-55 TaxID=2759810 RepID=UPI0015F74578|nr:TlpA disulfide reductase family protein [Colwellia sp. MB3u-55]MBA6251826.1 TlpA family protein disulfide reductase [Colwellia sp. MB3u-55]